MIPFTHAPTDSYKGKTFVTPILNCLAITYDIVVRDGRWIKKEDAAKAGIFSTGQLVYRYLKFDALGTAVPPSPAGMIYASEMVRDYLAIVRTNKINESGYNWAAKEFPLIAIDDKHPLGSSSNLPNLLMAFTSYMYATGFKGMKLNRGGFVKSVQGSIKSQKAAMVAKPAGAPLFKKSPQATSTTNAPITPVLVSNLSESDLVDEPRSDLKKTLIKIMHVTPFGQGGAKFFVEDRDGNKAVYIDYNIRMNDFACANYIGTCYEISYSEIQVTNSTCDIDGNIPATVLLGVRLISRIGRKDA